MNISPFKRAAAAVCCAAFCLSAAAFAACTPGQDEDEWPTIDGDGGINTGGTSEILPDDIPSGENVSSLAYDYNYLGSPARLVASADFTVQSNLDRLKELNAEVMQFIEKLESCLSTNVPSSDISRFNAAAAGEEIKVDELTYTVLEIAVEYYELTQGCYNPAVYYSVDLFGFSPRFNTYTFTADASTKMPYDRLSDDGKQVLGYAEPDSRYVEIFRDLASHMSELTIEEREDGFFVTKPDYTVEGLYGDEYTLAIDLGGLGKGYAADIVKELMTEYGFRCGYFDFGASSYSMLASVDPSQNYMWKMNLEDPDNASIFGEARAPYAIMYVADCGLSTSGDYIKCYTAQSGETYCHIIDPFTGRPKSLGIAACTLAGGTAAGDDALTTALLVMGESRAVKFINEHLKNYRVAMIVRDASGACSRIISNVGGLSCNPVYQLGNTLDGSGNIVLN